MSVFAIFSRPSKLADANSKTDENTSELLKSPKNSHTFERDKPRQRYVDQLVSNQTRRSSLPSKTSDNSQSRDRALKNTKSTPRAFAPLCIMKNQDSRHLHNCSSHCYLPHLDSERHRRMSCPAEYRSTTPLKAKKRRRSIPLSKTESNERRAERLHRCQGHFTTIPLKFNEGSASVPVLVQSILFPEEPLTLDADFKPTVDKSKTDAALPACGPNPIARSVGLLDSWSSHLLNDIRGKSRVSMLQRNDSNLTNGSSLHSISEE